MSRKGFTLKYVHVLNRQTSTLTLGMGVLSYSLIFPNAASSYWLTRLSPSGGEGNKKSTS